MTEILTLANAQVLDADREDRDPPCHIVIEGDRISDIVFGSVPDRGRVIDVCGRNTLAGLIDCHVHVCLTDANIGRLDEVPPTLMAARAVRLLEAMLQRGFTSVRDAAGADWGLRQAVEEGDICGPRLFISGRAISQTGGHGDFRRLTDAGIECCSCSDALSLSMQIADGCDGVRAAVREQFRRGADQIKIMVSGGVSSPHDPLEVDQYSFAEIKAAVDEACRRNSYVMAHAYGASAIRTALRAGVRTIEHGNLIDREGAELAAHLGAYVVPTLVTYSVMDDDAIEAAGWSREMANKLYRVRRSGLDAIRLCREAGVKLGYGTDLLGVHAPRQGEEFLIRSEVETPREIIRSATRNGAAILQRQGELGEISKGALADIIVVDGDPFSDLGVFQNQGERIMLVVKGGRIFRNTLH